MGVVTEHGLTRVEVMADSIVKIRLNSRNQVSHRLVSIQADFPRIILAEVNTHGLIARNSASSRAIPIETMLDLVTTRPFVPDRFPRTHKGMQAPNDPSQWVENGTDEYDRWVNEWLASRDEAVERVKRLNELGVSKQLANRILEPYLIHRAIMSATEWENMLYLRASHNAQNEFRILAELILKALNESTPRIVEAGEWHLPFGDKLEYDRLQALVIREGISETSDSYPLRIDDLARRITVARCARVSYRLFKGKDDYEADLARFSDLVESGHWSPLEHVARAMTSQEYKQYFHSYPDRKEKGWCAKYRGWIQLRRMYPRQHENHTDPRLTAHH